MRVYITPVQEFPHPKYPSLPCFKLTNIALNLHNQEQLVYQNCESEIVERLCRVLMMTREKTVHFQSFYNLKWDLGLPDDFDRNLIMKYPDCFRVVKGSNGLACLKLLKWDDEFVVSALQRRKENVDLSVSNLF
ncbi:hypothetical protein POM88_010740 [Heracleum sosnowskyi]|uniref:PORR domain-containing protein n=1 Tax=Heracleum sosnowskyi TaxID=360622 RepID=A0AAD8N072_9APIA|nr:hypothetical protein POM88_010740 [Heracleum sosnowskyi]